MSHDQLRDAFGEQGPGPRPEPDPALEPLRVLGRESAQNGAPRTACPFFDDTYPVRGGRTAWLAGFDEVRGRMLNEQIQAASVQYRTRVPAPVGTFLPQTEPMPDSYRVRASVPCQSCRALTLPSRLQAVICKGVHAGKAHLECRACGAKFTRRAV